MKRHHPTPALRNALFSAAMALLAGVVAVPAFAQTGTETAPQAVPPTATQPVPAAPATTPAEPHRTQAGPASVADLAEGLLEAVVNISTSQNVKGSEGQGTVPLPQAPEGSPFQDFFDEFFKDRQGGGGQQKVQSLGSGFVVEEAEGGQVRRFRQDAHRRLGDGDRQPVRPWRNRDRRHHLGAQPRHRRRPL